MAETSFPVANGTGVTDATYERLMGPTMGSGRYAFDPNSAMLDGALIYADNSGRQVKALANQAAIVRGFRWESGTTPPAVALDANTSGNPRIDLIVLRLERTTFTVRLGKTTGTPASVPSAPAPVQDTGSTGVWELPLAQVKVTSSGVTGQPSILAADVTPLSWWISPPDLVSKVNQSPPIVPGTWLHQSDTGKTFRAVGSSWALTGEQGAWTRITTAGGWTNDNNFAIRVNGWTHFQSYTMLNTASAKAPDTDITVCTLPVEFRPRFTFYCPVSMTPGQSGFGLINSTTGVVSVVNYPQSFPVGGRLVMGPIAYPSS